MRRFSIFTIGLILVVGGLVAPKIAHASPTCPTGQFLYEGPRADGSYTCAIQGSDQVYLEDFNVNGQSTGNATTNPLNGNQATGAAGTLAKLAKPTCDFMNGYTFTGCIWNPFLTWMGSWFLTIGGGWLRLAGTLMDNLIYSVIVNFKGSLDGLGIMTAINSGWTILRDLTNILIIGIFVFIALCIILGLKEFGQKKLIANVLIIAVLINFSLLFCEMIIDGSNFISFQIYKQMAGTTIASTNTPAFDIAGQFLKPMGISSVWNDTSLLTDTVKQETDSAFAAFVYGFIGGVMLFLVAIVLFYGCFLIAARAVLFIFLMLTAALAFMTYLVPTLAKGEYGWSAWWKALFNNAVFAPLIMVFMYISLVVMNAAGQGVKNLGGGGANAADVGRIISDPSAQLTQPGAWAVLLAYILGVGLLFLSFRMAHKFAGTISGFSLAGAAVSLPFAGLARGLSGAFGRAPIVGARAGLARSMKLEDEIKTERALAAASGNYNTVLKKMKEKEAADKAAKGPGNPLSSGLGGALAKATFVPKPLTEKSDSNYAEKAKKIADEAAKTGAAMALSKTEAENHVRGDVEKEREASKIELERRQQTSDELLKAAQEMSNATKENAGINRERANQNRVIEEANKASVDLNKERQEGRLRDADHQRLMNEQKERINKAREKITQLDQKAKAIDEGHNIKNLTEMRKNATEEFDRFQKDLDREVTRRGKELIEKSQKLGQEVAVHEAGHHGDSTIAELARRKVGGRIKNREAFNRRKQQKEFDKELDEK